MTQYKTKHRDRAAEQQVVERHRNSTVRGQVLAYCRDDWLKFALEETARLGNGCDILHMYLVGC